MSKRILVVMLLLTLCAGCGGKESEPTLTFDADGCTYAGPGQVDQRFTVTWVIQETGHTGYIYALMTIDEGHSLSDLQALPAEDPPPAWAHKLNYDWAPQAGTTQKTFDLSSNAAYQQGPVYLVCFFVDHDTAIGAVGPIEVSGN